MGRSFLLTDATLEPGALRGAVPSPDAVYSKRKRSLPLGLALTVGLALLHLCIVFAALFQGRSVFAGAVFSCQPFPIP